MAGRARGGGARNRRCCKREREAYLLLLWIEVLWVALVVHLWVCAHVTLHVRLCVHGNGACSGGGAIEWRARRTALLSKLRRYVGAALLVGHSVAGARRAHEGLLCWEAATTARALRWESRTCHVDALIAHLAVHRM